MEAGLSEGLPGNSDRLSSWNPAWRPDTQSYESSHDPLSTIRPADFSEGGAVEKAETHEPTGSSHGLMSNTLNASLEFGNSQDEVGNHDRTIGAQRASAEDYVHETSDEPLALLSSQQNGVDPAWGLNPETFRLEHTNSFPAVPPAHNDSGLPPIHSIPTSQIEDIMAETETEVEGAENDYNLATGMSGDEPAIASFENLVIAAREDSHKPSDMNVSNATTTPLDEESRFEEGLPLLPSTFSRDGAGNQNSVQQTTDFFGSDSQQQVAGEDLFGDDAFDPSDEASFFKPSSLARKTTSQVLDSMTYHPRNEVHNGVSEHHRPSTLENITESSVETPKDREELRKPVADVMTAEQDNDHNPPAKSDADLVAMWQAALADDDFLEDSSLDPTAFFEDDGDGFLEEINPKDSSQDSGLPEAPDAVIRHEGKLQGYNSVDPGAKRSMSFNAPMQTRYTPQSSNTTTFGASNPMQQSPYGPAMASAGYSATASFNSGLGQQPFRTSASQARPGIAEKAESFADKSKGGYTSPYDLPLDVSRPKKRVTLQHLQSTSNHEMGAVPPPPRNSSIQSTGMALPNQSIPRPPFSNTPEPNASPLMNSSMTFSQNSSVTKPLSKTSTGSFFEELPLVSKGRPSSSAGRMISQGNIPSLLPQQNQPPQSHFNQLSQTPTIAANAASAYQLLPPERMSPFPSPAMPPPTNQSPPITSVRYSPAPPAQPSMPLNRNRYATPPVGPPARPPSVSQILPFLPRTSSPLARSASASQPYRLPSQPEISTGPNNAFPSGAPRPSLRSNMTEQLPNSNIGTSSSNMANYSHHPLDMTATNRTPYHHPLQQSQVMSPDNRTFEPPQRSQTQSPGYRAGRLATITSNETSFQRSASVNDPTSPNKPKSYFVPEHATSGQVRANEHIFIPSVNYLKPSDGREHDPLERWKGSPLFNFGFGGHVAITFPRQIPRMTAGQMVPLIKCAPGEVSVRSGKIIPLDEHVASFPGPLKSKGKKKDILIWLEKGILRLEQQHIPVIPNQTPVDARRRQEEKILLWKILRVVVEFDGVVDGNREVEKAVRQILSPELAFAGPPDQLSYRSSTRTRGISSAGVPRSPQATDAESIEALRRLLLDGEREKAVWHAVDKHQWGHAMLIASTLQRDTWKQVTQEFVRLEVRTVGENVESLAALYDVFSGNWEESVDELVPPSARAGLTMVSKNAVPGTTKNALDGLDRWRETLSLILSNRSNDDNKALLALGRLLAGYGRIEAAHICYIFSKAPGVFGGPDDPLASITLLGADHVKYPFDYARDIDSILLTEVYDFALSVLASSSVLTAAPHLQAHKLHHAMVLAEYGFRDEAQHYCDAIMSTLKSTTRPSSYYHSQLYTSLDDLSSRLRQAPKDGSSSWINKPSMDKVSGTVWNKFNQFISGEDSDAASTGSGKGLESEAGPFALISGGTPSISRSQSPDLYGPYANGDVYVPSIPAVPSQPLNSRYAPIGTYAPRKSIEQSSRPMPEVHRSNHIESLMQPDLQRQPSYSSLGSSSPDLIKKQLPDPHHQALGAASALSPVELNQHSSKMPTKPSYLSQSSNINRYSPSLGSSGPVFTQPDYQADAPNVNAEISSAAQHLSPHSVETFSPPLNARSLTYQAVRSPSSLRQRSPAYAPRSASESRSRSYQPSPVRSEKPLPASPPGSYEPQIPHEESTTSYAPPTPSYEPVTSPQESVSSYQPPLLSPPPAQAETSSAIAESTPYGYEPPSSSGYEPPSYTPETQTGAESPVEEKPKKSSYSYDNDSDDETAAKAAALKREEKARKDREADEAFRKAAEADAQKDSRLAASSKSSWLSWIAPIGKSKDSGTSKAPIKARLGEESSFVYDETLKKWVNKKAGVETPLASAPAPPPPKGPPSRASSAAGAPPSAPSKTIPPIPASTLSPGSGPPSSAPSRNASPHFQRTTSPGMANLVADALHQLPEEQSDTPEPNTSAHSQHLGVAGGAGSTNSSATGPPSAPPSRPATGMSNASSIDDLLGAPQARKGGTVKKTKKGRGYVDVMAK